MTDSPALALGLTALSVRERALFDSLHRAYTSTEHAWQGSGAICQELGIAEHYEPHYIHVLVHRTNSRMREAGYAWRIENAGPARYCYRVQPIPPATAAPAAEGSPLPMHWHIERTRVADLEIAFGNLAAEDRYAAYRLQLDGCAGAAYAIATQLHAREPREEEQAEDEWVRVDVTIEITRGDHPPYTPDRADVSVVCACQG